MYIKRLPIIILVVMVFWSSAYTQYVEPEDLPKYDCQTKKWNRFELKEFIIVTPNETDSLLENRVMVHSSWYDDTCLIKSEKELNPEDYEKNLWILGTVGKYEHWERFQLPIEKTNKGFVFNNIEFNDSLDGIGIVDTNRIVFIGNSSQTIFGLRAPDLAYGFDFVITQNNKKTYFGNFLGDSVEWSNLIWLKESNYLKYQYDYIDFYVSRKFDDYINLDSVYLVLKDFAEDFTEEFKIMIPVDGPLAFIHEYHSEITNMTAFWDGACTGHIRGFNIWDEIHTEGFGFNLIKHEFGHHVFNSNFRGNIPTIIKEGAIEHYFNRQNPNREEVNIVLTKVYADSLNFVDLISDRKSMFGLGKYKGKDIGYGVSGILVSHIIEEYGLDRFQTFCNQEMPLESISTIFEKTPEEFVADLEKWIDERYKEVLAGAVTQKQ